MNDVGASAPRFDAEVERLLEYFERAASRPFRVEDIAGARQRLSGGRDREIAGGVRVRDVTANGVEVRLYVPASDRPLPLHLYLHGGGFIFGSALSGSLDGPLSRRAAAADAVVASVEYRLAPEHRFPAGVEDSYAALTGLLAQSAQLGLDPTIVTVGGASSGGNFAAVVALMARDRAGPALALQLLEIAGTDLTKSSHAWRNPVRGHDTTRERDLAMVDLYLTELAARAHPYASPLFAPDLRGLAPAYVMNAQFDPRRDECEAYVARLQDAGVPAIARTMEGHVHGSMSVQGWAPALAWEAEAARAIAAAARAARSGSALDLDAIGAPAPA